jgi:hypothetical protein
MQILEAIKKIYPDWRGVVWENDYSRIKPHELEKRPIPSLEELQSAWSMLEAERAAAETALKAAEAAAIALETEKAQAIVDNLPSWDQVKTFIDAAFPDPKQNEVVTRIVRVTYWLARNSKA